MSTTTISGASSIDDNLLYSPSPTANYGTYAYILYGGSTSHAVIRFSASLIPAGKITGFRLTLTSYYAAVDAVAVYRVLSGNDWTESGATWNNRKASTAWLGSGGCSTSGTDYVADASPPTVIFDNSGNGQKTITLPTSWVDEWASYQGIVLITGATHPGVFSSDDGGGRGPIFEIDWHQLVAVSMSGGALAGYTATFKRKPKLVGAAGALAGAAATFKRKAKDIGAAGALAGGVAALHRFMGMLAVGGSLAGGASRLVRAARLLGAAGAVTSGAALEVRQAKPVGQGGALAAGAAGERRIALARGVGGGLAAGTVDARRAATTFGSAGALAGGAALERQRALMAAHGGVVGGGRAPYAWLAYVEQPLSLELRSSLTQAVIALAAKVATVTDSRTKVEVRQ